MNKKIASSVLIALMIAGSTSLSVFAAMPICTLVIGTKAFDLDYANNSANFGEINAAIIAGGSIYIKTDEYWIDNYSGLRVQPSVIPAVVYKAADGEVTNFSAADTDVANAVKPIVLSIKSTDSSTIEVAYSEAVSSLSGLATYNYTVAGGPINAQSNIVSAKFKENTGNKTVILTTIANDAGNYFISINGVKDIDGNLMNNIFDQKFTIAQGF